MYIHLFKCGECRYFGDDNCPWNGTKENNIAGECFCHKIATVSWNGTSPFTGFGEIMVATAASTGAPIEVKL